MAKADMLVPTPKNLLRNVELNILYYDRLQKNETKRDNAAKLSGAIAASSTFATSFIFQAEVLSWGPFVWQGCALVAAVLGVYSTTYNPAERARKAESIKRMYVALRPRLRNQLRADEPDEVELAAIEEEMANIKAQEPPQNERHIAQAQIAIVQREGKTPKPELLKKASLFRYAPKQKVIPAKTGQ